MWWGHFFPSLFVSQVIELRRPSDSRLEHVDFDSLFSCLSVRQVLRVFASLLLERRVIFVADKLRWGWGLEPISVYSVGSKQTYRNLSHRPPLWLIMAEFTVVKAQKRIYSFRFLTVDLLQYVLNTSQQRLSRLALSLSGCLLQGGREVGHMSVLLQEVKWVTIEGAAAAAAGWGGSGGTDTMWAASKDSVSQSVLWIEKGEEWRRGWRDFRGVISPCIKAPV